MALVLLLGLSQSLVAAKATAIEQPVAVRAAGLAGACGPCRGGVESLWFNPAGLLGDYWDVQIGGLSWLGDTTITLVQGAWSWKHIAVGAGFQHLSIVEDARDALGKSLGSFGYAESTMSFGLAGGSSSFAGGLALRSRHMDWDQDSRGQSGGVQDIGYLDLGFQGTPDPVLTLSAGLRGFAMIGGGSSQNCGYAPCLPHSEGVRPQWRFGAGLTPGLPGLQVLNEAVFHPGTEDWSWHIGAEQTRDWGQDASWALRLGWRSDQGSLGSMAGFSAGLGLRLSRVSLNYAFSALGDFGLSHRAMLSLSGRSAGNP